MKTLLKYLLILISTASMAQNIWSGEMNYTKNVDPLIQNVEGREVSPLNGRWEVVIDQFETGYYNHRYQAREDGFFKNQKQKSPQELVEYEFNKNNYLNVPGDWNTQDEKLFFYEGTIWYKRDFNHNPSGNKRQFLYFGAVNYECIVYLNGEEVGKHEGGYTPFNIEITDKVKQGNNFVVLKVDNKRRRNAVPTVNIDWWNFGGITRHVYLVQTPKTFVRDYKIQLKDNQKEVISGWVKLSEDLASQKVNISIPELKINQELTTDAKGFATFETKAKPVLWTPENPKLYSTTLSYAGETVNDKIGFRTIATDGYDILLNGESVFLRGICIHEVAPFRSGRAWSEEDARTLLGWAKELNCNFVRLAHYPHNETMIKMADEMGLMVWSEIPVYWTIPFEEESVYQIAQDQLTEMIARDKNRASVIIWSVANETPIGEPRLKFLSGLISKTRELDPTRLVSAALDTQSGREGVKEIDDPLGQYVDVIGINSYCGWYGPDAPESCGKIRWENHYKKPMIMSEIGGGALQGLHGPANQRWTEEYLDAVYVNNIEMMKNIPFLRGVTPWLLTDFMSPKRLLPGVQDYYNRKGLISDEGRKKLPFYTLQEYYQEIKENGAQHKASKKTSK